VSAAGAKHNARIGGTGDTPLDQAQKGQEQAREAGGEAAVEQAGHNEVIWLLKHPKEAKKLPPPEMEAPPQPAAFEAGVGTVRDAGDAVRKRFFSAPFYTKPPEYLPRQARDKHSARRVEQETRVSREARFAQRCER